jgi:hypothetical protein
MFKMARLSVVLVLALVVSSVRAEEGKYEPSFAFKWIDVMQEVAGNEIDRVGARPTIISRQMGMIVSAMYDAWACYDEKAVGTRLGGTLRRPAEERTEANKQKAIAFAMYRVMLNVYPDDRPFIIDCFKKYGFDPDDKSEDVTKPEGIGNKVAAAIIAYRQHDGANQLGDEIGGNGKPYSDYTYYKPYNPENEIIHPDRWKPITFDDGKGGTRKPGFLTPHWYRVKSFGLKSPDQFRPGPPATENIEQLKKETLECIEANANLTTEQKAIVEFMRDGPRSTGQSGHWLRFAQDVSKRDKNNLDADVKLYFCVAIAAQDAFISCWETKRFYDTSRPYWYARYFFKDADIKGWGGPGKGTVELKGKDWRPYSPSIFITPPFPGYTSGHATVSGACAKVMECYTGSDTFGIEVKRNAGELTEPELAKPVVLKLPTFTATAEMAATSRMLGGYHVRTDNEVGLKTGQKIGEYLWPILKSYFDGTAKN